MPYYRSQRRRSHRRSSRRRPSHSRSHSRRRVRGSRSYRPRSYRARPRSSRRTQRRMRGGITSTVGYQPFDEHEHRKILEETEACHRGGCDTETIIKLNARIDGIRDSFPDTPKVCNQLHDKTFIHAENVVAGGNLGEHLGDQPAAATAEVAAEVAAGDPYVEYLSGMGQPSPTINRSGRARERDRPATPLGSPREEAKA